MTKRFHVAATAICHIDYGIITAEDGDLISQVIIKEAQRLKVSGDNIVKTSLVITEVQTTEVRSD